MPRIQNIGFQLKQSLRAMTAFGENEKACKAVKIEREIGLSFFEKKILRKASEQNRKKGIELATEICRQHRREGKFFDEILTEALNGEKT